MSLRARMGLAAGVAVALAVIAVAVSAYAGTRSNLRNQVDQSLRHLGAQALGPPGGGPAPRGGSGRPGLGFSQLQGGGERPGVGDEGLALEGRVGEFGAAAGIITLLYRDGGSYVPPGQRYRIPIDARAKALAKTGRGGYLTDLHTGSTHLRVLATGIGNKGALLIALPLTDVDNTLSSQLLLLVIIAAAGIALAALLGLLVARTALSPIARFTRQTESIATNVDRLEHERLEVSGSDELSRLAQTFNTTLDALERSVQAQRNLVADASHELRTPIASLRANLQLLRDEALLSAADRAALRSDMIEELDELTGLVGDVVELARGAKPSGGMGDVRLDEIVAAAIERTRRRAPELDVQARLEPTLIKGEGDRLSRAISNLLDNAVKWSPPGGLIDVELRDGTLSVRDHGPGFREEDLPFVFDRFHRAKEARSKPGSGLGLAIVRQAAEAHDGFVEASNAPDGGAVLRIGFGPRLELEEPAPEPLSAS
jgi:two-component system sensor histidine kinase MprB